MSPGFFFIIMKTKLTMMKVRIEFSDSNHNVWSLWHKMAPAVTFTVVSLFGSKEELRFADLT